MLEYTFKNGPKLDHFLKVELYERLGKFFKMNPEALIYKDMEEIEKICNDILDNKEVDVVHMVAPNHTVKIKSVNIIYETNELGFVIPSSCNYRLNY